VTGCWCHHSPISTKNGQKTQKKDFEKKQKNKHLFEKRFYGRFRNLSGTTSSEKEEYYQP
jgi:hypothetical protein